LTAGSAAQTEPGNQLAVPLLVLAFQIVEQLASLVDHPKKTLAAMVILLVLTEVLGEL
jgi:hypothetical protein